MQRIRNMKLSYKLALGAAMIFVVGLGVGAYAESERLAAEVSRVTSENAMLSTRSAEAEQQYAAQQASVAEAKAVAVRKTTQAAALEQKVYGLKAQLTTTKASLASAKNQLASTKTELASVQAQVDTTPVPLGVQYGSTDSTASGCDPNYDGACVPPVDYDLDCADVNGTVYAVGDDPHGFDGDGDGVGCEYN